MSETTQTQLPAWAIEAGWTGQEDCIFDLVRERYLELQFNGCEIVFTFYPSGDTAMNDGPVVSFPSPAAARQCALDIVNAIKRARGECWQENATQLEANTAPVATEDEAKTGGETGQQGGGVIVETLTFPISQSTIRAVLREALAIGSKVLADFLESNAKGKGGYCINWTAINLSGVDLCFDEDSSATLQFRFDEGQCSVFNAFIRERLVELVPPDYRVEVISEW
jgi:hypothetical protein